MLRDVREPARFESTPSCLLPRISATYEAHRSAGAEVKIHG